MDLFRESLIVGQKIMLAFCRGFALRLREASDRIVGLSSLARPS